MKCLDTQSYWINVPKVFQPTNKIRWLYNFGCCFCCATYHIFVFVLCSFEVEHIILNLYIPVENLDPNLKKNSYNLNFNFFLALFIAWWNYIFYIDYKSYFFIIFFHAFNFLALKLTHQDLGFIMQFILQALGNLFCKLGLFIPRYL